MTLRKDAIKKYSTVKLKHTASLAELSKLEFN